MTEIIDTLETTLPALLVVLVWLWVLHEIIFGHRHD